MPSCHVETSCRDVICHRDISMACERFLRSTLDYGGSRSSLAALASRGTCFSRWKEGAKAPRLYALCYVCSKHRSSLQSLVLLQSLALLQSPMLLRSLILLQSLVLLPVRWCCPSVLVVPAPTPSLFAVPAPNAGLVLLSCRSSRLAMPLQSSRQACSSLVVTPAPVLSSRLLQSCCDVSSSRYPPLFSCWVCSLVATTYSVLLF